VDKISYDLSDRTILLTGASSGIGEHFAEVLGATGAKVVLAARRFDKVAALADKIKAAGGKALAVEMDVESEASVKQAYDAAEAAFGVVHTIYANAGTHATGLATEIDMAAFDQVISVNMRGVFLTAREGARRLVAQGPAVSARGRVVLVASIGSFKALDKEIPYGASKAALIVLAKSLGKEWAPAGICVNAICPGSIRTPLSDNYWETNPAGKKRIEAFPRTRLMGISDLDDTMLLLGADQAKAITGASLVVDDGQTL